MKFRLTLFLAVICLGSLSRICAYDGRFTLAAETSTSDLVVFTKNGLGSGTLTTRGATATLDVTVVVGDGQTMLSGVRSALQQAQASGASQLLINTGEVVDTDLVATLAQRAASGQGFLGGTVTSTGTSVSGNPLFQILIKVGK